MKNFTTAHIFVIILSIACMITSSFPSIECSSFNGWTMQSSTSIEAFSFSTFLVLGIIEIILLFSHDKSSRKLAVFVSLAEVVLPWLSFCMKVYAGSSMADNSSTYTIMNVLPFLTTLGAVILLILNIYLFRNKSL